MTRFSERDVPDQTGRLAIVTGANSGIGFHTARVLAERGARVVLACRDVAKARDAVQRIASSLPGAHLDAAELDLADLDSVRRFSDSMLERHSSIDLLVNNAGIMAVPQRGTTKQDHELQFGTNHLGHFALTGLLISALVDVERSRVVTVSSNLHKSAKAESLGDLDSERSYEPFAAYNLSKLANVMFTLELERRLRSRGARTIATAAHPGWSSTALQKGRGMRLMTKLVAQSPARGALPTLAAATDPDARGGDYYGPAGMGEMRGPATKVGTSDLAKDETLASRLWEQSEEMTGVTFAAVLP